MESIKQEDWDNLGGGGGDVYRFDNKDEIIGEEGSCCFNEHDRIIKQEHEVPDDSRTGTMSLSEEAMAWNGEDMQHLEVCQSIPTSTAHH